jgi:hypothetical protein
VNTYVDATVAAHFGPEFADRVEAKGGIGTEIGPWCVTKQKLD